MLLPVAGVAQPAVVLFGVLSSVLSISAFAAFAADVVAAGEFVAVV